MINFNKFFKRVITSLRLRFYRLYTLPRLEKQIREKKCISVAFCVWSLGSWKSESLYKRMLIHDRFRPILILVSGYEKDNFDSLKDYCDKNNYSYEIIDNAARSLWKEYRPDIIFYQKPYGGELLNNLNSLFCYTTYAFHNSTEDWAFKTALIYCCWQVYYENKDLCLYYTNKLGRGVWNGYATGIPPMDDLLTPKEQFKNPWKGNNDKKRIIFAPHHSINPDNWWQSSTFLETGELMLELAEKYSDSVQWAFKPHPLLRSKLEQIWGKKKTDEYYNQWEMVEWSQFENGDYIGLFKHSDAMIHDCGSFIEEYHVTQNPVMFLIREKEIKNPWNDITEKAFQLHYKGRTREEIEQFIQNVIDGKDSRKEERMNFFDTYLTLPNNRSACENIMDCILSPDAKKKYR